MRKNVKQQGLKSYAEDQKLKEEQQKARIKHDESLEQPLNKTSHPLLEVQDPVPKSKTMDAIGSEKMEKQTLKSKIASYLLSLDEREKEASGS